MKKHQVYLGLIDFHFSIKEIGSNSGLGFELHAVHDKNGVRIKILAQNLRQHKKGHDQSPNKRQVKVMIMDLKHQPLPGVEFPVIAESLSTVLRLLRQIDQGIITARDK